MQVHQFAPARERRDHRRFLELQAAFKTRGYTLDYLTEESWDLRDELGCRRGVRGLDEADRLLKLLEQHQGRA